MAKYNGHKNYNHWNVSLWLNNDKSLYRLMQDAVGQGYGRESAAKAVFDILRDDNITHTPDGAPYSVSAIRAAMVGM